MRLRDDDDDDDDDCYYYVYDYHLTAHSSLLTAHYSLLTTHYSLLTTLTTYYSLTYLLQQREARAMRRSTASSIPTPEWQSAGAAKQEKKGHACSAQHHYVVSMS